MDADSDPTLKEDQYAATAVVKDDPEDEISKLNAEVEAIEREIHNLVRDASSGPHFWEDVELLQASSSMLPVCTLCTAFRTPGDRLGDNPSAREGIQMSAGSERRTHEVAATFEGGHSCARECDSRSHPIIGALRRGLGV